MEAWYKFTAYNTQSQFGYGTADQAEKYADHLNKSREINVYNAAKVEDADEIAKLDKGYGDGFNLDDVEYGE